MQFLETKPEPNDWEHIQLATRDDITALKSNSERIQRKTAVLISEDKTLPLALDTSDDHELLRSNLSLASEFPGLGKEINTLNLEERREDPLLPSSTRYTSIPAPAKPTPPPRGYNPQKVGISLLPVAIETEDDEQPLTPLGDKLLKRRQKIESAHEHLIPDIISTENVIQKPPRPASQITDDITKQGGAKMNQVRRSNTLGRQPSVANQPVNILSLDQKDDQLQAILERRRKRAEGLN